jgi:predicted component of type VI protein secretion system
MYNSFNILSTRKKSAIIRDDMGMPEFHDLDALTDDTLYYVARLIITQLQLFEKRLQNIRVNCLPDHSTNEISMSLSIKAEFIFQDEFHMINLELDYFNDGKLVLRT